LNESVQQKMKFFTAKRIAYTCVHAFKEIKVAQQF